MKTLEIFPTTIHEDHILVTEDVVSNIKKIIDEMETPEQWEGDTISSFKFPDASWPIANNDFFIPQVEKCIKEVCEADGVNQIYGGSYKYRYEYWWNYAKKNNYQEVHNHYPSRYSAIVYLTDSDSHTVFYKNDKKHYVKPEIGKIVIFPGELDHYVQQCNEDERITVAFNFTIYN